MSAETAEGGLPAIYQPWIEELLGDCVPAETEATCDHCAMLTPASAPEAENNRIYFDPRSKCCTYIPALPNFLVGRVLLDLSPESAAGRASVQARIDAGVGVTPAGVSQPPTFLLLYRSAPDAFGRSISMRCPHYLPDTGACGIWRHRNAVCSTWFCKHVRGAVGQRFWAALRQLLEAVERSLVAHCVLTLAPGSEPLPHSAGGPGAGMSLSANDVDGVSDPARHRAAWGQWAGREREFYEASAHLIAGLAWSDVVRIAGAEVELAASVLRQRFAAMADESLPARLRLAAVDITKAGGNRLQVTGYSAWDPLVIPKALGDVLHVFDGRSPRAALAASAKAGLEIDAAVVKRLVDFEVLVADHARPRD